MTPDPARTHDPARVALRAALVYGAVGALWIFASDVGLSRLVPESGRHAGLQTLKGMVFVAATAALLYLLLRRALRGKSAAEDALRESVAQLEALVQASPLAIFVLDGDGTLRSWNPAAEGMFGWSAAEVVGRPFPVVPAERAHEFAALCARVLAGEVLRGVEVRWRRKDGGAFDVSIFAAPLRDESGRVRGILCVVEDVTERKQLEERFRQAEKMEALGRLAGGVAHDFNNLLTVLMGHTQLLAEELPADEPARSSLEEMGKAVARPAELTRQLLAFSRKEAAEPRVLNLNLVVGDMAALARRLIGEDVELRTELAPRLWRVRADPGRIRQVIMNLLVNARQAMPRGGTIMIRTANVEVGPGQAEPRLELHSGQYVRLSVTDTGIGMDAETASRVFEPFFTTKPDGTGLGLATVYAIVKQSGGHIWVESEPGRGATFTVLLPRAEAAAEAASPANAAPWTPGGRETILLVEDDEHVRRLAAQVLRRHGYTVFEAGACDEALALCEGHGGEIHLAVVDLVLPRMSGPELASRIAALRPSARFLFISGYGDPRPGSAGGIMPRGAFLQKPFSPDALARRVREILDQGGGEGLREANGGVVR